MLKKISKRSLRWLIPLLVVVVAGLIGFGYWNKKRNALPAWIASGNGRIEGKLVDVAAKEPLRVKEIFVDDGDLVTPGQVLVELDTVTLEAELDEAEASINAAQERLAFSRGSIAKQRSEVKLAEAELTRSTSLVREGAGSQRELDVRTKNLAAARASLAEAEALMQTSLQGVEVARAKAATIQTRIDDATLRSPVTGRVLYRLAETGEVLPPGGKALTLVNLEDIYMEIFLPSKQAGSLAIGAEGRITVDFDPGQVIAGYVSFVSPEAQFTPKQVETRSEREKLMFRVKIRVPKETAAQHVEHIKTGVRGVGYVKLNPSGAWPAWLQKPSTASVDDRRSHR